MLYQIEARENLQAEWFPVGGPIRASDEDAAYREAEIRGDLAGVRLCRVKVLDGSATDHLTFVEVVEVFEREDGIYVFDELCDAERFEDAVAKGRDLPSDESATYRRETPIIVGAAAERLIASERGDVLEDQGEAGLAGDLREGASLQSIKARVERASAGPSSHLAEILRGWIKLDTDAEANRPVMPPRPGDPDYVGTTNY